MDEGGDLFNYRWATYNGADERTGTDPLFYFHFQLILKCYVIQINALCCPLLIIF